MNAVNRYTTPYHQDLHQLHQGLHLLKVRSRPMPKECSRIFGLENEFKVSVPLWKHNIDIIKDHLVERRHPANKQTLMYPTNLYSIITKDKPVQLEFNEENGLCVMKTDSSALTTKIETTEKTVHSDVPTRLDDSRPLECSWLSAGNIQQSQKLKEATKSSGNVFGNNGLLLVESCLSQKYPEFNFCEIEEDQEFKDFFNGLVTFKFNEKSPCFSFPSDGVAVTYYYDNKENTYLQSYLLDEEGANGSFVETHPFPHVFTPGDKDSVGKVLLSKECSGAYHFALINLKYGEALYLPENTIHSDSSTVGNLFVALTVGSEADTVLVKDKQSLSVINLYP